MDEAVAIVRRLADLLISTATSRDARSAADLRRAAGEMAAHAETKIQDESLAEVMARCFDLAREAGASLDGIAAVRRAIIGQGWSGPVQVIAQAAVRLSLIQEAQILASTDLRSRDDAARHLSAIGEAFAPAEEYAADNRDADAYKALIALRAAVVRDITERMRPLPQMVSYRLPPMPALKLAQRLYSDAERASELVAENNVVHPLFMPGSIRALTA